MRYQNFVWWSMFVCVCNNMVTLLPSTSFKDSKPFRKYFKKCTQVEFYSLVFVVYACLGRTRETVDYGARQDLARPLRTDDDHEGTEKEGLQRF